jgi:hypothetical protein
LKPIILEGPDGSGKSTLAAELAKKHGLTIVKNGPDPGIDADALLAKYVSQFLRRDAIIDRCGLSEVIYARAMGREDRIGADGMAVLRDFGALWVICLPPFDVCSAAWAGRDGELFQDERILREVHRAYASFLDVEDCSPDVCWYDWTLNGSMYRLERFLEERG